MKKKYWYKFFVSACYVCGDVDTTKERQYSPKPKRRSKRYDEDSVYCGCMDQQMLGGYF